MLYLTEADVLNLLSMPDCLALMRTAFERLASGEAINQPRRRLTLPTKSTLHYMAGSDGRYFGAKVYSTNPGHKPHFLFLLYRAEDAELLAVIEANHLGQIRTGAASGYATQLLARPDSRTLAVIGSGFQAQDAGGSNPGGHAGCRPDPGLEPVGGEAGRLRAGVRSRSRRHRRSERCEAPTSSSPRRMPAEPVLESDWIAPGTHINAMGSNQARRRELPAELVRRADLIVADSIEQSRMESGDLLLAFTRKAIGNGWWN